ncbi:sugar efflux transporter [Staphylococcus sp. SQ8-PEA]|uniref:Sugar efflux transporter n=1 Tax=Staphylococcus marylandisciuri TaxID=2981529 RepID=A0ABT2QP68_9STAP|nr:sugar efflux transporter [Staphylococcus marylandisciuri]MCU5745770.1 sugar efflux transporter [Staphylococcus marylandisciuri]
MFKELLHIKNYKLFVVNMMLLGIGIAITIPFLVLFATEELGMTQAEFGLLLAVAAISQFVVNAIVARFSDTHNINRKVIIITALFMGALSFSLYFYVHNKWIYFICYALFQGLFAPAMPQMYASAREAINLSTSRDRAKFANAVLRSMFSFGFLFGPLIGNLLQAFNGYAGLFSGTVAIILFTLILQVVCFREVKTSKQMTIETQVEDKAPNMLKNKTLLIPFTAFILLHIGQWMYTLNMPLFVTHYLQDSKRYVGVLASLCAGLEVPFMILLGILSTKIGTRTLLMLGGLSGSLFFVSIGVFEHVYAMIAGQLFLAFFLAILLGLGITYFQDVLPDFPGYSSTLFANAMVIGQLCGNLLGGAMGNWVGQGNVFYISALSLFIGVVLIFFTKDQKFTS